MQFLMMVSRGDDGMDHGLRHIPVVLEEVGLETTKCTALTHEKPRLVGFQPAMPVRQIANLLAVYTLDVACFRVSVFVVLSVVNGSYCRNTHNS